MPLTDRSIRALKPGPKPMKIADTKGLYVLLHPNGSRYWRLKYRFNGREKALALGVFPDVSLARARDLRDDARRQLAAGIDPGAAKRAAKQAEGESFEAIAREWFAKEEPTWVDSHADRILRRFERDVFPLIGARPVAGITAPEVLAVAQRIVDRGAVETAHRAVTNIGQVMRFATATGRATSDPTPALKGALPSPQAKHHAAITDPKALGDLLRAIEGYSGSPVVRAALRLAPYVFLRPGELRHAEWAEIHFEAATWTIPGRKMKIGLDHVVPLSRQSIAILREIEPLTHRGPYVFPSPRSRDRAMSDNALNAALRRMGFERGVVSAHGFRATARTLLDEKLGFPAHLIEHQLSHRVRDANGRAYNRTSHLPERQRMMQRWSDYLDTLRDGAQVVPIRPEHRAG